MTRPVLGLLAAIALAGCGDSRAATDTSTRPRATATAAAGPATTTSATVSTIPVQEDFEAKAASTIDSANVQSQLDALEKEIGN